MCGIAGFFDLKNDLQNNTPENERCLKDMYLTLSHRGNDSFGKYLRPHIGLAHARLSIRDIAIWDDRQRNARSTSRTLSNHH